jgi:SAM-dependent methyltransferase
MQRAIWHIQQSGARSVLELGCGNGKLLYFVKDTCDTFGIDISPQAIERMKKEYGLEGMALDVYDLDKIDRKFDFIAINHTLEHLWRDGDVVRSCFNHLNPGGTFFAGVPNNISGPDETDQHVRKYNMESMTKFLTSIFGNCELEIVGQNHLIGIARKNAEN